MCVLRRGRTSTILSIHLQGIDWYVILICFVKR